MAAVQPGRGFRPAAAGDPHGVGTPRMMVIMLGAAALVVGAVAALALDNWAILLVVLAIHLVGSALVIGYSLKKAGQDEGKPDPLTEARLEEEQAERT
jgi:membrane protein implicated in regulation of membrane protease activity